MANDNNPWESDKKWNGKDKGVEDIFRKVCKDCNFFRGKSFNFNWKVVLLLLLVIVAIWFSSGLYIVQPEESGVELVFGKYNDTTDSGLHYNFPVPIGKVFKVKTATVQKEQIGFNSNDNRHNKSSGIMLTGDENIVNISFEVQWRIQNPYKYLFNLRDDFASKTIKSASEGAMREAIGHNSINFIMIGEGRAGVSAETSDVLQKILNSYDMGVDILSVQLIKVDPPEKVIDSFRDVQSAKADKEREVNQAQAYYNDKIPKSRGQANRIIEAALAYKQEIVKNAEGEASKFNAIYNEYAKNKNVMKSRLYLEAMESMLQDMDKIVLGKDSDVVSYLPLQDLLNKRAVQ